MSPGQGIRGVFHEAGFSIFRTPVLVKRYFPHQSGRHVSEQTPDCYSSAPGRGSQVPKLHRNGQGPAEWADPWAEPPPPGSAQRRRPGVSAAGRPGRVPNDEQRLDQAWWAAGAGGPPDPRQQQVGRRVDGPLDLLVHARESGSGHEAAGLLLTKLPLEIMKKSLPTLLKQFQR